MEKRDNNILRAFHIRSKEGEPLRLFPKKYTWHIPRSMRVLNIQPGDIVGVRRDTEAILVVEVFREDIENVGKKYKSISALRERAPEKE